MDNNQPIEETQEHPQTIGSAVSIKNCARCGVAHNIQYMRFSFNKVPGYDMWAMCPITNEPILIKEIDADA